MKMIMAVVQDQDTSGFLDAVAKNNWRATRVSTTGGFLRSGNSTILIGVQDDQVAEVLGVIRATCRARRQPVTTVLIPSSDPGQSFTAQALDVEVGGANFFVWDIEQHYRL